jgi:hypothetical protein
MKRATLLVAAVAVVCGLATTLVAQRSEQQEQKPQQKTALDLVEVVGCLAEAPDQTWILANATDAAVSKSLSTTKKALSEAATRPLGNQRYHLLGVRAFDPAPHKGHKVAAKGVLIKDDKESRLNVTSLQMVAVTCAK